MTVNLKLIILFGSRSRETQGRQSDFDVAALANHPLGLQEKVEAVQEIAREFDMPEDRIDLVDIWSAPPLLQHHIAMTGKLLKGNKDDFLGFRALAWKRYLDTAKLRRARENKLERLYAR